MGVTVEAEGMGGGLAEFPKALFAVDVVSISRNQESARLQLDTVAWAESKGGPFCRKRGGADIKGHLSSPLEQ